MEYTRTFSEKATCWGWPKFAPLATLRSRPGYLAGDRLLFRVRVEVLPPSPPGADA